MLSQPTPAFLKSQFNSDLQELAKESEGLLGLSIIDLGSGETFGFASTEIFPQASAIKIPILMEVYRQSAQGKFSLDQPLKIERADVVEGSGIIKELEHLPSFSVQDLALMMIKYSDNTATNVLIDLVGMESVNRMLQEYGFEKTRLNRKMMDTEASQAGRENLSTPEEAAQIMQLLYQGKFVDESVSKRIREVLSHTIRTGGTFASALKETVPVVFKWGEIPGVHTEWLLVQLENRPFAVGIMEKYGSSGSRPPAVFTRIAEKTYQYFWKLGNASPYGAYFK